MTWNEFIYFALPAAACWLGAGAISFKTERSLYVDGLMVLGSALFGAFIGGLWAGLERPPLRTMGETRLWYSFFLAIAGHLAYRRWNYPWLLLFSSVMATVFIVVNLSKPEIHSIALMPALQSYYFVPHVTVYILSYAMLGVATIASVMQLVKQQRGESDAQLFAFMDNIVYTGFGFLALGMLTGALWAKEAWGHYWSWDPKETWAFITGAAYLVYIHLRVAGEREKIVVWTLPVAFILLMVTWLGVSYLPAAQGSIHVYS